MGFLCVICREDLESSDPNQKTESKSQKTILNLKDRREDLIVATKCGHMFHQKCLSTWLSSSCYDKPKCPTCKGLIYTYELIQLFPSRDDLENFNSKTNEEFWYKDHLSNLRSSSSSHQEMLLSLIQCLLKDLEQRDQIGSQDGSPTSANTNIIGSLKAQVASVSETLEEASTGAQNRNANIIAPNGTTIPLGQNTQRNLTKEEEVESIRILVEMIQRQKDEMEELLKTHRKELRQELLNFHQNLLISQIGKASISGLLCYLLTATSSRARNNKTASTDEDYDKIRTSTRASSCDVEGSEDDDGSKMLSHKVGQVRSRSTSFRLGDKVGWEVRGQLHQGTVKWKGFVGSTIHVGVEFETPIGLVWIENDLNCLFKSKAGHGYLVPVEELITNKELVLMNRFKLKPEHNGGLFSYYVRKICKMRPVSDR